jgi:hypothetical protein
MKKYYLTVAVSCAIIVGLSLSLLTFLELPTVGVSEGGQCVYIESSPNFERESCPTVLPKKYNMIYVLDPR